MLCFRVYKDHLSNSEIGMTICASSDISSEKSLSGEVTIARYPLYKTCPASVATTSSISWSSTFRTDTLYFLNILDCLM